MNRNLYKELYDILMNRNLYKELYDILICEMPENDAVFCASVLCIMPSEKTLAMIDRIAAEKKEGLIQ